MPTIQWKMFVLITKKNKSHFSILKIQIATEIIMEKIMDKSKRYKIYFQFLNVSVS